MIHQRFHNNLFQETEHSLRHPQKPQMDNLRGTGGHLVLLENNDQKKKSLMSVTMRRDIQLKRYSIYIIFCRTHMPDAIWHYLFINVNHKSRMKQNNQNTIAILY